MARDPRRCARLGSFVWVVVAYASAGCVSARNRTPPDGAPDMGPPACEPGGASVCPGEGTCAVHCSDDGLMAAAVCSGPQMGTGQPAGQVCARDEDCAPGLFCAQSGCAGIGVCRKPCQGDGDCGEDRCAAPITCSGHPSSYRACTVACDPLGGVKDGCNGGLRCKVDGDVADCRCPPQESPASCMNPADCAPGETCSASGSLGTCVAVCMLEHPVCPDGTVCRKLGAATVYGGCVPRTVCQPATPTACASSETCEHTCLADGTGIKGQCTEAGAGVSGTACTTSKDCARGLACLIYTCAAGKTQVCAKYCGTDADCSQGRCIGASTCGGMTTPYKTCVSCDPTGAATCDGGRRCALGANYVPSCFCPEVFGRAQSGQQCTTPQDCAAGLGCAGPAGNTVCRPLCRMGGAGCAAGTSCRDVAGTTLYGVCY